MDAQALVYVSLAKNESDNCACVSLKDGLGITGN